MRIRHTGVGGEIQKMGRLLCIIYFARVQMPREPQYFGSVEAGLLTSPPSRRRLPGDDADHEFATSGTMPRDVSRGVTAAGTVQEFHLIPFSSLAPRGREPQHVQFVAAKIVQAEHIKKKFYFFLLRSSLSSPKATIQLFPKYHKRNNKNTTISK